MADMNIRYEELLAHRKGQPPLPTAVVHPCSEDALIGAVEAAKAGLIAPLLVGPKEQIGKIAAKSKIDLSPYEIVPTADAEESASVAANLAGSGKAGALMKGSLHTDQYMHAVLQRENGLRTSRLLSHCMLIAAPAYSRTIVVSDAAVNIAPDLDQKRDIVQNAIILARAVGISQPKVAVLAAIETVNSKMQASLDAAALAKMADRRQIVGGIVDGPLAFDNAVSRAAAETKQIVSPVAGDADILVVPDLESGNMLAKQLIYLSGADSAGIVLGARVPIVLTSRSDGVLARLASCALAVLLERSRQASK
jgi:phosphotransacetylase